MPFHATILTLFPDMFPGTLGLSLAGKALREGKWGYEAVDIRAFATDRHRTVDDHPAGGGAGMILKPDILAKAIDSTPHTGPRLLMSPRGKPLTQKRVRELADGPGAIILCGRFEGVDERVRALITDDVSVGDYVLSGGELAALLLLDSVVRLLPGVLRIRFRGQDRDLSDPLPPVRTRLNMQHCSGVLVPARILQHRFQNILWQPVRSVALGVDSDVFHFDAKAYAEERRPTLRILGRLDPIKGHQHFFGIFRQVLRLWPKNRPQPWLEIIGQAANISAADLQRMAGEQGLREGENWRLVSDRVTNLAERMSGTDLAVISSLGSEVICRVAEEFLLCGVPLCVSGVGALEECLLEKSFGCSYRQLNAERTATLLTEKLWQASRETQADRKARAAAASQFFSLGAMGRQLVDLLSELQAEARES